MTREIINGSVHTIKFTPVLAGEEKIFRYRAPDDSWTPYFTKTATHPMLMAHHKGRIIAEHINVDGELELIELPFECNIEDNFYNIGWQKGSEKRYLRVDVLTGETRDMRE